MKKQYILDCTLRDGGYINEWNFGEKEIGSIIEKLDKASVDFVECGFLTNSKYDANYSLFEKPDQIKKFLKQNMNAIPVAMIALGEKEISYDDLPVCDGESIKGIRLTFHKNDIEKAKQYSYDIMKKGYLLFVQPVGIISYTDKELLDLLEIVNEMNPFAFYIVDTLGTMHENELMQYFYLIDKNLNKEIKVGFHSHNNLQLSFSNAQALLRVYSLRDVIIDASVLGMGRGAGNLCTELITQYINESNGYRYDVFPLLEIVDKYLEKIKRDKPWGYSIPYFIAAINQCHPNYATFFMNKQTININDIEKIILCIKKEKRAIFDREYVSRLYDEYQENDVDDGQIISELTEILQNKNLLLLAPGKSLITQEDKIRQYIQEKSPFVISINVCSEIYKEDALFISNKKRFKKLDELQHGLLIATSNIRDAVKQTRYIVNYSSYTNADKDISDDSGTMLLNLLARCGVNEVTLAGFDGYKIAGLDNYFSSDACLQCDKEIYEVKNKKVGEYIRKMREKMVISFLTKTNYEEGNDEKV